MKQSRCESCMMIDTKGRNATCSSLNRVIPDVKETPEWCPIKPNEKLNIVHIEKKDDDYFINGEKVLDELAFSREVRGKLKEFKNSIDKNIKIRTSFR